MASHQFKKKVLPWLIKLSIGLGIALVVLLLTQGWLFEISILRNIDLLTVDYRYQSAYNPAVSEKMKDRADVVIVEISDQDLVALP